MNPDKEIRADAKLKNLSGEVLDTLWRLRYPEEGGEKWTLERIAAALPELCGFTASLSSVSEFYAWLRLKRRMEGAAAKAQQTRLQLAKDPEFTPEAIERVADTVFASEALDDGDIKAYVAIARLRLTKEKHELERQKLQAAAKGKIEAGLDALYQEIRGNARAEAKFKELQEVVAKA